MRKQLSGVVGIKLQSRLHEILSKRSLTCEQISCELNVDQTEVRREVEALRRLKRVFNVGGPAHPIWAWGLEPNPSKRELTSLVIRLLSERPMTLKQVADVGGVSIDTVRRTLANIREAALHRRLIVQRFGGTQLWFLQP